MTVLTMRYQQGHFVVSGPDMEHLKFKTRREAQGLPPPRTAFPNRFVSPSLM